MATKRQASGAVSTLRSFVKKCKDAKAAGHGTKKPKKRKKAAAKRDWPGHKKAHSVAAKKGHRKAARKKTGGAKKRKTAKKRATHRRDPAFYGHPAAHARAARKGARHRRHDPGHSASDPRHFSRARPGPHRGRGHAPGGWRMTRDPE